MTSYDERLEIFEARLDSLAEVFCPDEQWGDLTSGPVLYRRCERKRFRIGKACAQDPQFAAQA